MTGWRAWVLMARRQWGARKGLVGIVLLSCLAPVALTVVASIASSSAAPRPGELAGRELGPYQVRVQADSSDELRELQRVATSQGATRQATVLTTPSVLVTPTDAAEVTIEAGDVAPAWLRSRYRLLTGSFPGGRSQVALTRNAAVTLGVGVGSRVQWQGADLTVIGVFQERGDFQARTAFIRTSDVPDQALGDPARTHHDLYLAGAADAAALQDAYQRTGYGVLSRMTGADQVQHSDGEFITLLAHMAAGLLVLSVLSVVACMAVVARLVDADLDTLDLLGFARRSRMALSASVGLTLGLVAVAAGLAVGIPTALLVRGPLEGLLGAEWYRPRMDTVQVLLAAGVVVLSAAGSAAAWSRPSAYARSAGSVVHRDHAGWERLATSCAVVGVLLAVTTLVAGKSTLLLVVCVLLASALAVKLWFAVVLALVKRHRADRTSARRMLFFAYLADRPVAPLASTAIVAALFAFPVTAVLMIAGLEGDGGAGPVQPNVPQPELAVYDGPQDLTPGDLAQITAETGAEGVVTWTLALLPAGLTGEQASAWIPVIPEAAARACATDGGRPSSPTASQTCETGFRGAGIATVSTLEVVLGRSLTSNEQDFFAGGGALTLDRAVTRGNVVRLVPTSALASASAAPGTALASRLVTPGPGTEVSSATPAVWLSAAVFGRSGTPQRALSGSGSLREGQQEVAFRYSGPVTVQVERLLRRAIVTRVEVGDQEEFLATRLDATHVSLVRRVLDDFDVVALLLAVAVAIYGSVSLRHELRGEQRVFDDFGLSVRASAAWRAGVVGTSAAVGAVAALATGAVCGVVIVQQEVGGSVPVSGWVDVAPVVAVPVLAAVVAALMTAGRRGRTTAWGLGFARD